MTYDKLPIYTPKYFLLGSQFQKYLFIVGFSHYFNDNNHFKKGAIAEDSILKERQK